MRSTVASTFAGAIFVLFACNLFAQDKKPAVERFAWMTGCWEQNDNGRVTIERWGRPTENLVLGTSQTIKGTKSVGFEFLRIVDNGHGPMYVARPHSAKEETPFAMVSAGENEVTFENLKHDFPQRIIYRLAKPDALNARIEGTVNGQLKGIDIPMKRVKCD